MNGVDREGSKAYIRLGSFIHESVWLETLVKLSFRLLIHSHGCTLSELDPAFHLDELSR